MSDIWDIVAKIGIELHPDRVNKIAARIERLQSVEGLGSVRYSSELFSSKSLFDEFVIAWKTNSTVSPSELAAAMRGASRTATLFEESEEIEMVWTGPSTGLIPTRHTAQVLLEVIRSSEKTLFIVSFVAYDIDIVTEALKDALERKVKINLLLESSKDHGGKIDIDSIKHLKRALPSANFYAWNLKTKSVNGVSGAVHAKCVVADKKMAFISSANLTMAAMETNMELGVLVRGGNLPNNLERHLEALVSTGKIEKI